MYDKSFYQTIEQKNNYSLKQAMLMILKKRNLALPVWVSFNTFQYFAFYIFKYLLSL